MTADLNGLVGTGGTLMSFAGEARVGIAAPLVRRGGGTWIPVDVQASGADAAFTEIQPVGDVARHAVFPAGGEGVTLNVPPDVQRVELAGSLVAFRRA